MDEQYRRINIDHATIVIEQESSMLYAITKDRIAKPIYVNFPDSDHLGNLILNPDQYHAYLHEHGFAHSHDEICTGCEECS